MPYLKNLNCSQVAWVYKRNHHSSCESPQIKNNLKFVSCFPVNMHISVKIGNFWIHLSQLAVKGDTTVIAKFFRISIRLGPLCFPLRNIKAESI